MAAALGPVASHPLTYEGLRRPTRTHLPRAWGLGLSRAAVISVDTRRPGCGRGPMADASPRTWAAVRCPCVQEAGPLACGLRRAVLPRPPASLSSENTAD